MLAGLHASAQINSGRLITKNNYFEIPFTETANEIHTKATIRGDEYDFMLDTGAPAFISTELQKKYKFKTVYRGHTQDAGGNMVKMEIVVLDTIRFGPFIFTDIPAIVIDMKESTIECLHLPGNIGSNILRHLYVQFDINGKRVACADSKSLLKKPAGPAYPMRLSGQNDVYFPVKLNDSITDTIHYDSGDASLYSISKQAMNKYIAAYPADVIRDGFGTMSMGIGGAGEPFPQYVVKPQTIKAGSATIAGGAITVAGNDRSRMGRRLLNYGMLQLNYPDSTYSFDSYTSPAIPPRFDFGFHPIIDGDDLLVGTVWKNSSAERQGLQPGDHILKIDDLDFTTMSKCDRANSARNICDIDKQTIAVTFRHKKQKPQTITVEKKDL